jgi:hypothetical protein
MRQVRNVIAKDEIDFPAGQCVHQHVAHRLDDAQQHLGKMLTDRQGKLGAGGQHQRRGDPEPDGFAFVSFARRHFFPGFFDQLQDRERAGVQQAAGLGRLDATRMADKQRDAQVLLDLADLHAERGLRDVKLIGGARHVAGLHHTHEVSELAQVHERLLRRPGWRTA